MMTSDLSISKLGPESDLLLRNLLEHYVHDMTEWFDIDVKPDGSYSYDTSSIWEDGHEAYLAKVGDSIAGFALIGSREGARDVHEFFVLRRFRRHGIGRRMAGLLWQQHRGDWLVRVLEANSPAVSFWCAAIADYSGGAFQAETRTVNERPWRYFRFVSPLGDSA